jgi:hypothetical protein
MRIYIAGPITGMPGLNRKAFSDASKALKKLGYEPINPMDYTTASMSYHACMRIAIGLLVSCDAIALLRGWEKSKGALIEYELAKPLKIPCKPLEVWL